MRISVEERIDAFAKIFSKEQEAEALKVKINTAFDEARAAAAGKGKNLIVLINDGKLPHSAKTPASAGFIKT